MRTQSADTDLQAEAVQVDLLRKATVARRVATAISLSQTMIELACRAIRRQHPNLSRQEVLVRFVEIHYGSQIAERLSSDLARRPK